MSINNHVLRINFFCRIKNYSVLICKFSLTMEKTMDEIKNILKSKIKPKEKVSKLADELAKGSILPDDLIEYYFSCPKAEKGHCIEAIELMTKSKPELGISYIDFVIEQINHENPSVKREASRVVANMVVICKNKMELAIPLLLKNTKDEGTVVRWSAAYALSEIAIQCENLAPILKEVFKKIISTEPNNGVKNIYVKCLKKIN